MGWKFESEDSHHKRYAALWQREDVRALKKDTPDMKPTRVFKKTLRGPDMKPTRTFKKTLRGLVKKVTNVYAFKHALKSPPCTIDLDEH